MPPAPDFTAIADLSAPFALPAASDLHDSALIEAQRALGEIRRRVDAAASVIAAEIHHRSRRELGYDGLAQRLGVRTPELLVQRVTGLSSRDARSLVRVGVLVTPAEAEPSLPWLASVATAVANGDLSVEAAEAIRAGLGTPVADVTAEALTTAAQKLVDRAPSLTVERLAAQARDLRTELDLQRVTLRENELREKRYLHLAPQADGMTRLSGLLDPESAAIVTAAYDAATSPRRGGPRFVDPDDVDRADNIVSDARTTEQLALDCFVELVRLGTLADDGGILGTRRPAVTVHVTAQDLRNREGVGRFEGQSTAVSIQTVERHICEVGMVPVLFDGDQNVVNIGRDQRFFTRHQRIGLAARDGGCRFPQCERPPSWAEAHHIDQWSHGGKTDITRGILLCRHHHLLVHNNGWAVTQRGGDYWVVPPAAIDPEQRPIPAPSKSATQRRLVAARA